MLGIKFQLRPPKKVLNWWYPYTHSRPYCEPRPPA